MNERKGAQWLILWVDWATGYLDIWPTVTSDAFVRVFLDEINI